MQGSLVLDIVSGSGLGHETPVFEALSERSNYRRDSQSTVAGPPSCAVKEAGRVGLIAKYYAHINSNIPLVAPAQLIIIFIIIST